MFFGIQVLGISILKYFPNFVEQYYSNGLYPLLSKLMRFTFGWLPFSFGDIFYTLIALYGLRWLIVNRQRITKDTKNWFLDIGAALSIVYFSFHLLWAFNYYRQPLHVSLEIEAKYTTEELLLFTNQLVEKSNAIHNKLSFNRDTLKVEFPYTKKQVFDKVMEGYKALSKTHPKLNYKTPSIKKSLYSLPLTYMGFSGYFNPFTNEAQVDGLIPIYKFPTTACHEVAHQLGFAAENEANFIGALAAVNNTDLHFKYSGFTFILRHCLSEIYRRDTNKYKAILKTVNKGILKNYQEVRDFWMSYKNPLEPAFEKTYDTFLKANNQAKGIESYNYAVGLFINYYKTNTL